MSRWTSPPPSRPSPRPTHPPPPCLSPLSSTRLLPWAWCRWRAVPCPRWAPRRRPCSPWVVRSRWPLAAPLSSVVVPCWLAVVVGSVLLGGAVRRVLAGRCGRCPRPRRGPAGCPFARRGLLLSVPAGRLVWLRVRWVVVALVRLLLVVVLVPLVGIRGVVVVLSVRVVVLVLGGVGAVPVVLVRAGSRGAVARSSGGRTAASPRAVVADLHAALVVDCSAAVGALRGAAAPGGVGAVSARTG